jgi:hypothetical protein
MTEKDQGRQPSQGTGDLLRRLAPRDAIRTLVGQLYCAFPMVKPDVDSLRAHTKALLGYEIDSVAKAVEHVIGDRDARGYTSLSQLLAYVRAILDNKERPKLSLAPPPEEKGVYPRAGVVCPGCGMTYKLGKDYRDVASVRFDGMCRACHDNVEK